MQAALFLIAVLLAQADEELERALKAERDRIASRKPLSPDEVKRYAAVSELPRPAARPRASYALAVVPLELPDAKGGSRDLEKGLGRLADYYKRVSGGAFALSWKVRDAAALDVTREALAKVATGGREEKKALERAAGGGADGILFLLPGAIGARGTALWPHKDALELSDATVDYLLVAEDEGEERWISFVAHEFGHLLGLEDKYEDKEARVGRWCLMGTGYLEKEPLPLCGVCRERLGWASIPTVAPPAKLALAPGELARVPVGRDGREALVLEMREGGPIVVWHTGGGRPIELAALLPTPSSDRQTPYSDPPFLGRTLGSRPVWLTDARVEGGIGYVRIDTSCDLTPLEELRRSRVGRTLGK